VSNINPEVDNSPELSNNQEIEKKVFNKKFT
jgi:hypothetical protein